MAKIELESTSNLHIAVVILPLIVNLSTELKHPHHQNTVTEVVHFVLKYLQQQVVTHYHTGDNPGLILSEEKINDSIRILPRTSTLFHV